MKPKETDTEYVERLKENAVQDYLKLVKAEAENLRLERRISFLESELAVTKDKMEELQQKKNYLDSMRSSAGHILNGMTIFEASVKGILEIEKHEDKEDDDHEDYE